MSLPKRKYSEGPPSLNLVASSLVGDGAEDRPSKRPSPSPQTQNDEAPVEEFFRNLYLKELDFRKLGQRFPEFGKFCNGKSIDFENPTAFMELTKTLLKAHFGLYIEVPRDRLCPPVPNRHNYILFLKHLLDSSTYHSHPSSRVCTGIDIGTGASAIYPLLGAAQRPWSFLATEADLKNTEYARRNVTLNKMDDKITILGPRDITGPIIPLDEAGVYHEKQIDFLMTNPPFYESEEELSALAKQKARPPLSACTGALVEMVCPGGEVAFVSKIVLESLGWKDRIRWYTSMLGKLESVERIVKVLRENSIDNYAVNELVQGSKTKRWVIAWSFGAMRPSHGIASGIKAVGGKKVAPAKGEEEVFRISGGGDAIVEKVRSVVLHTIGELDFLFWEASMATTRPKDDRYSYVALEGVGRAEANVWGRGWRRMKARGEILVEKARNMPPDGVCGFGFSILVGNTDEAVEVIVKWREGHDHVMFESFCGFLKRKLAEEWEQAA